MHPNYAEVATLLLGLLEDCYAEVGGRTKKKLRQLFSTPKWGPAHRRSFDQLKQHLADQTKLVFPKPDSNICLCTDASEIHWSGVLALVQTTDRHQQIEEQRHEPLGFVTGSFKVRSHQWPLWKGSLFDRRIDDSF
jgi:RNase H-like domain found in reverse transcriptase